MSEDIQLLIGGERIMRSRIEEYYVSPDRKRLVVKLKTPKELRKIEGAEHVTQAILELNYDPNDE